MLGYVFVGAAFGLLIQNLGLSFIWAGLMSLVVYAGSMQFVMINFLSGSYGLPEIALVTLLVNMRHMVYGLTFIEKFKSMGWRKFYMIFALTDETYALLCAAKIPPGVKPRTFFFTIALLNQLYWIIGTLLGALFGTLFSFNAKGIEFTMTALFAVICVEQWLTFPTRIPALIGAGSAFFAVMFVGPSSMLLPSMILIILILTITKPRLENRLHSIKNPNAPTEEV
jgi:4-azaleucine resistance transporter AzlC